MSESDRFSSHNVEDMHTRGKFYIRAKKKKDMMKYVKQKRMGDDVKSLKRVEYHFRSVLEEKVNSC